MSQAQERRRAEMWESHHKEGHEKRMTELRAMKQQLASMDPNSDEYKTFKVQYDERYTYEEAFFMKYYET